MSSTSDLECILVILWSYLVIKERILAKTNKTVNLSQNFYKLLPDNMLFLKLLEEKPNE